MRSLSQRAQVLVGVMCFLMPGTVTGQVVTSKDGNIWFGADPAGKLTQLTATSRDREPNLSPDGHHVVFVRGTPGSTVEGPTGDEVEKTELWMIRTDGTEPRLLLRGGSQDNSTGFPMAFFQSPQFSPDGNSVYFLSIAAVVTGTAYALDLKLGHLREVCPANSLLVVRKGRYAGNLVVEQHRYFEGGGSYNWVWLVTPQGKEIGPLGDRHDAAFELRLRHILDADEGN